MTEDFPPLVQFQKREEERQEKLLEDFYEENGEVVSRPARDTVRYQRRGQFRFRCKVCQQSLPRMHGGSMYTTYLGHMREHVMTHVRKDFVKLYRSGKPKFVNGRKKGWEGRGWYRPESHPRARHWWKSSFRAMRSRSVGP